MKVKVAENTNNPLADKGLAIMPLTGSIVIVNNKIDRLTISMYRLITNAILHDESPITLATEIQDFWECEAETLYDNTLINHREFENSIMRICSIIKRCQDDLGVTF